MGHRANRVREDVEVDVENESEGTLSVDTGFISDQSEDLTLHKERYVSQAELRALTERTKHCMIQCYYSTGETMDFRRESSPSPQAPTPTPTPMSTSEEAAMRANLQQICISTNIGAQPLPYAFGHNPPHFHRGGPPPAGYALWRNPQNFHRDRRTYERRTDGRISGRTPLSETFFRIAEEENEADRRIAAMYRAFIAECGDAAGADGGASGDATASGGAHRSISVANGGATASGAGASCLHEVHDFMSSSTIEDNEHLIISLVASRYREKEH